jgi:lysophospholipase L1-like esterase
VLCYGDSNTWGAATVERPDRRYGPEERWPGVLRAELGAGWLVIEEGLGGRTTVSDDPVEGIEKNGSTYLLPCLASHKPLDVVIIMLGTNDLKLRFGKSAWEVAAGVGRLVDIVKTTPEVGRGGHLPAILVVCPPPFVPLTEYAEMFVGAEAKSRDIAKHYRAMATTAGVHFLDAGTVIRSSAVDGFHLDPDAHLALGRAVAAEVTKIAGSVP